MINKVELKDFNWIDLDSPTIEELEQVAKEYNLESTSMKDCLDPEHFPKAENFDNYVFLISRYFDDKSKGDADTTQELTRKIAFFVGDKFLITVHRTKPSYWNQVEEEIKKTKNPWEGFILISSKVIDSYLPFLDITSLSLEDLEARVFHSNTGNSTLQKIHFIKRKLTVLKHLFSQMQPLYLKIPPSKPLNSSIQDLRERTDSLIMKNSSLIEESYTLLQLYLTVSSNRTNDIMRLLTVVSVFFMPLNFLAGVYGMNFQTIPLTSHPQGFYIMSLVFILISMLVYLWFKAKNLFK